jgi:hypothetical protein
VVNFKTRGCYALPYAIILLPLMYSIIKILAGHVQLNKPSYITIDTHNYSLVNKSIYYFLFYLIMLCMLLFLNLTHLGSHFVKHPPSLCYHVYCSRNKFCQICNNLVKQSLIFRQDYRCSHECVFTYNIFFSSSY